MSKESIELTKRIINEISAEENKTNDITVNMHPVTVLEFYKEHIPAFLEQKSIKKFSLIKKPLYAGGFYTRNLDTGAGDIYVFLKRSKRIKKLDRSVYKVAFVTYHELRHTQQSNFDPYSNDGFYRDLDMLIQREIPNDYLIEHPKYSYEIDANLSGVEKTRIYMQTHYPELYEQEKAFIDADEQKYMFYKNTYDCADTIERALYVLRKKQKSSIESSIDLESISPVLSIFLNPDLSFKSINEIIANPKTQLLSPNIIYSFLSTKSFLETLDLPSLSNEELNLLETSLEYTNQRYIEQLSLLQQQKQITLRDVLKAEKSILLKLRHIKDYAINNGKHFFNTARSDSKQEEHAKSIPGYLGEVKKLTKQINRGSISLNTYIIVCVAILSILSIVALIYLLTQ